jgi:hypothetical protein
MSGRYIAAALEARTEEAAEATGCDAGMRAVADLVTTQVSDGLTSWVP